jgi:hypothetical protein
MSGAPACWIYRSPADSLHAWQALRRTRPELDLCAAEDGGVLRIQLPAGAPPIASPPSSAERLQTERTRVIEGSSAGEPAPWLYVVETDVLPEFEAEFNAWYDEEHLPGLAAVPGVVRATRLRRIDGNPVHHACYDLAQRDAFGSPRWVAVRATPWSTRVRAAFRDTRRVMHRRV